MSHDELFNGMVDKAMSAYAERLHGRAASVVDPETGKHAMVVVRRIGERGWSIHTSGSPAFARALEQRLGLGKGEAFGMDEPVNRKRLAYLAHASENKCIARPLAEGLMARGIDVWYDSWEIGYGDSLRRKMDQGLGDCTHFIVLLTQTSIGKAWVNEEIDAGLMNAVEGSAKFISLRHDLPVAALPPLLKTRLAPEFNLGEESIEALAAEIYGVSRKPTLGDAPHYVKAHKVGSTWSLSARVVAEYFVRNSAHAQPMDPQATYAEIQQGTRLPMPDVRIGVLDLVGAGLLDKQEYVGGESSVWPRPDLFATFDADFMDWNPQEDARKLAAHLASLDSDQAGAEEVGEAMGWAPRRFNAAAGHLVSARVVEPIECIGGGDFWPYGFMLGDELLRFVRSQ